MRIVHPSEFIKRMHRCTFNSGVHIQVYIYNFVYHPSGTTLLSLSISVSVYFHKVARPVSKTYLLIKSLLNVDITHRARDRKLFFYIPTSFVSCPFSFFFLSFLSRRPNQSSIYSAQCTRITKDIKIGFV